jgi:hypothetical protein
MIDDWTYLKRELDRVEGRTFRFGTYDGWSVERVGVVNRDYLFWCLEAVPMRAELRRTILRVLSRPRSGADPRGNHPLTHERRRECVLARGGVSSTRPGYASD